VYLGANVMVPEDFAKARLAAEVLPKILSKEVAEKLLKPLGPLKFKTGSGEHWNREVS